MQSIKWRIQPHAANQRRTQPTTGAHSQSDSQTRTQPTNRRTRPIRGKRNQSQGTHSTPEAHSANQKRHAANQMARTAACSQSNDAYSRMQPIRDARSQKTKASRRQSEAHARTNQRRPAFLTPLSPNNSRGETSPPIVSHILCIFLALLCRG